MPILGVVLTHPSPAALAVLLRGVSGVVAVGEPLDIRLPAVLETTEKRDDEPLLDALRALEGVLSVDLAFADFSDLVQPDPTPLPVCP